MLTFRILTHLDVEEREREKMLYLRNLFTGVLIRDATYLIIIKAKGFL